MLKTMRKNVKTLKPTLWIIIATFVIAIFAIWGGAGRLGETSRNNVLVTIGKERISSDAYFQTLRQRLEAMKKEYSQLNKALIQQLNIPQQVLQQMVEQALLLQIAEDMKLDATDPESPGQDHLLPRLPEGRQVHRLQGIQAGPGLEPDSPRRFRVRPEEGDPDRQGRQAPDGRHHGLRRGSLGKL